MGGCRDPWEVCHQGAGDGPRRPVSSQCGLRQRDRSLVRSLIRAWPGQFSERDGGMSDKLSDDRAAEESHTSRVAAWRRWYWPIASLVALVAFELTASPTLSAVLMCCHFAVDDGLTAVWLVRRDPSRGRGWTLACFSLTRGIARAWMTSLGMLMLLVIIEGLVPAPQGQLNRKNPDVLQALIPLFRWGWPTTLILGALGCVSARVCGVRVWLDPALHTTRQANQWPPLRFGKKNRAIFPYTITLGLGVVAICNAIVVHGLPPPGRPVRGQEAAVAIGIIVAMSLFIVTFLGLTKNLLAETAEQCWNPAWPQPPEP